MKITTLCFGNINRSPAAKYILEKEAADVGLVIEVESAGTSNYNEGKRANKTMRDKLAEYSYNIEEHRAKQITQAIVDSSDVILCMEPSNKKKLITMFPSIDDDKIVMIADFIVGIDKVPDPHFATKEVKDQIFTECYEAIQTGCYNIVQQLSSGKQITNNSSKGGMFDW